MSQKYHHGVRVIEYNHDTRPIHSGPDKWTQSNTLTREMSPSGNPTRQQVEALKRA